MKITDRETRISSDIDYALRVGDFQYMPLQGLSQEYAGWYARLLSTLTLLVGEDPIVYAQTDFEKDAGGVEFTLLTDELLVRVSVAEIASADAQFDLTVVGRQRLESLRLATSARIDQDGSLAYAWPGAVSIVAKYAGMDEPVHLSGPGYDAQTRDTLGPIAVLLDGLKTDLTRYSFVAPLEVRGATRGGGGRAVADDPARRP